MKYRLMNKDTFAVMAITIIAVALILILPLDWVLGRLVGLPLVLILPGYALTTALFPKREFQVLQYLVFSIALSLVTVVLGGLVLNLTPFGLQADSWAVLLGCIILSACAVTLVRRRGQSISTSAWLRVGYLRLKFGQVLLLCLSALIICGAFAMSIIGAEHQPYPGFTQLWILPAGGATSQNTIRLGVNNMESTTMKYRLAVNVNGKKVVEWPSLNLNPKQKWETTFLVQQTSYAGKAKVEADLYRADAPTSIYRHVVLWLGT